MGWIWIVPSFAIRKLLTSFMIFRGSGWEFVRENACSCIIFFIINLRTLYGRHLGKVLWNQNMILIRLLTIRRICLRRFSLPINSRLLLSWNRIKLKGCVYLILWEGGKIICRQIVLLVNFILFVVEWVKVFKHFLVLFLILVDLSELNLGLGNFFERLHICLSLRFHISNLNLVNS